MSGKIDMNTSLQDSPFWCRESCTCGADLDEACKFKVIWFDLSCGYVWDMLQLLWVLSIINGNIVSRTGEDGISGKDMHDLLEPLMVETFK